jgi:hypothetical protein
MWIWNTDLKRVICDLLKIFRYVWYAGDVNNFLVGREVYGQKVARIPLKQI